MATENSINNASNELTIDPGAGADSFVQFDIGGSSKFRMGSDSNDSNAFKISAGSDLGTSDTFRISVSGERTMPLQPAFLATLSATQTDVTGNFTPYSYVCNTEIFDQGGDYNNSTGIFTAPVTGTYIINARMYLTDCTTVTDGTITLRSSNRDYFSGIGRAASAADIRGEISFLIDMDAADTVFPRAGCNGEGANTVDLSGVSGADTRTAFSGYLAC